MEKRKYIAPQLKAVNMIIKYHIMDVSGIEASANSAYGGSEAYSRESSIWDEEEEEENTGGWFQ